MKGRISPKGRRGEQIIRRAAEGKGDEVTIFDIFIKGNVCGVTQGPCSKSLVKVRGCSSNGRAHA